MTQAQAERHAQSGRGCLLAYQRASESERRVPRGDRDPCARAPHGSSATRAALFVRRAWSFMNPGEFPMSDLHDKAKHTTTKAADGITHAAKKVDDAATNAAHKGESKIVAAVHKGEQKLSDVSDKFDRNVKETADELISVAEDVAKKAAEVAHNVADKVKVSMARSSDTRSDPSAARRASGGPARSLPARGAIARRVTRHRVERWVGSGISEIMSARPCSCACRKRESTAQTDWRSGAARSTRLRTSREARRACACDQRRGRHDEAVPGPRHRGDVGRVHLPRGVAATTPTTTSRSPPRRTRARRTPARCPTFSSGTEASAPSRSPRAGPSSAPASCCSRRRGEALAQIGYNFPDTPDNGASSPTAGRFASRTSSRRVRTRSRSRTTPT